MSYPEEILLVEDNPQLGKYIRSILEKDGYLVTWASSGEAAFARLRMDNFNLVLLDLMLGDVHGLDVLKVIRRHDSILPVIIVSNSIDLSVKVDGFEVGCDDYITKPFYAEELLSRVKRQLVRHKDQKRRFQESFQKGTIDEKIEISPFTIDLRRNTLYRKGQQVEIRKKLLEMLIVLAQQTGEVVSRETLMNRCWGESETPSTNTLYVHIRQLREILEEDPEDSLCIKTIRGEGFSLQPRSAS